MFQLSTILPLSLLMNKNILRLAVPNIISNITVPLLSMVDLSIVGHLDSQNYIGAIATSSIIFNFIYWSFSFLRMGTSGFTAQSYGASNMQETSNVLLRSFAIAIIGSVLILLLQKPIFDFAFLIIKASPEVTEFAQQYFFIYVWAAPAILLMYSLSGWFVGMQDSKTPMFVAILINVINIVLSLFLVLYLKLDIKGVALASTIAQYMGVLFALLFVSFRYKHVYQKFDLSVLKKTEAFKSFFKVNSDIFIRTLLLISVTAFFTAASASSGDLVLAANALLMQFFTLFSYIMDGFAYASEALTGKYVGAKKTDVLSSLIKRLFSWGFAFVLLFTIGYYLLDDTILSLMTDKEEVIAICKKYEVWILLIPVAGFSAFLWDGVFVGAMASAKMRDSMFIAAVSFYLVYYALISFFGNNALWFSFIIYLAMRGIIQSMMYPSVKRKILK